MEFWSNTGRDFSAGKQSITQTTARMSSVNKDFEQECSGENLTRCNLVRAFLFYDTTQAKTETVVSVNRNEDKLIRPVYTPRSVESSAVTKPMRIPLGFSDFCPREARQQQNLCGSCMWNHFSTAAARTGPAWGEGLQLCSTLGFFSERSSVLCSRRSAQAKHRDMSRQRRARHRSVAAEIARGTTSLSRSQITLRNTPPTHTPSTPDTHTLFFKLGACLPNHFHFYIFSSIFPSLRHVALFSALCGV